MWLLSKLESDLSKTSHDSGRVSSSNFPEESVSGSPELVLHFCLPHRARRFIHLQATATPPP